MVVKYLLAKLQEMLDFTHNLRPPLCFHLEMEQKQTTSELSSLENEKELKAKQDEYTQLVGLFNEEILGKGGLLQRRTQILREEFYTKLETDFPGWNEDTAFVLYNLFTERADYKGATIEYIDLYSLPPGAQEPVDLSGDLLQLA
ncbi:hypothetical protein AAG570_006927 [Ranatra chinensis]|uniref:Uncharacterized protein n=1 Tax=Ranatra chinensis TaxID=642074 RepID=A0ABD0YVG2_9HEMI